MATTGGQPKHAGGEDSQLAKTKSFGLVAQASASKEQMAEILKKDDGQGGSIDVDEHTKTVPEVARKWDTDSKEGLKNGQIQDLQERWGKNQLTPPRTTPWYVLFFHHQTGFFSLLLWLAAGLCFLAYGLDGSQADYLYLGVVLAVVVFLTGIFSYYQDAKSAAVMAGFKNFLPDKSQVIRGGIKTEVPSEELVPGDLVELKAGQKIPADMRVVASSNFKVDNSSLTGESEPQSRDSKVSEYENHLHATNLSFYGTLCVKGRATGIVISTGDRTVIGSIAKLASTTAATETPIAIEIAHFIHIVSSVAVFLGVTFLIIGFAKGTDAVENLVFCIGIIVANVPEGLLATVTVSLTLTAQRMAKKKVLVKNLEAVETLGSTTVIASDKTGTLTQNRMTAVHVYYDCGIKNANVNVRLAGAAVAHENLGLYDPNAPTFKMLQMVATLCNNATFVNSPENDKKEIMLKATDGDASESAFIKFCELISPIEEMRKTHQRVAEIPFNSANKYQVSFNLFNNDLEADRMVLMKGAPERIFNRCKTIMQDGKETELDQKVIDQYNMSLKALMCGGERVLGCAMKKVSAKEYPVEKTEGVWDGSAFVGEDGDAVGDLLDDLCFVGLIALIDPPRAAVPNAVLNCQKAGIRVIMVTGDHPDTAEAIAKQVNIISDVTRAELAADRGVPVEEVDPFDDDIKAVVITGAQLETLDAQTLDSYLDFDEVVFARTSPKQKLIIVQALQNKKFIRRHLPKDNPKPVHHVVAVTGDGVNDSPALKAANIGVAMGIVGSDVAKEAADMILLDDNFASIVQGVEEGRLIFDNLKKSIAYTLSSNIPEISPFLLFILMSIPLPLPTVLILCIDLGTDMVPAISLAYENKEANIMEKPPRDMNTERLVTAKLVSFSYLQIGVVQAAAGFFSYLVVLNDYGFPPWILPGLAEYWKEEDGLIVPCNNNITGVPDGAVERYDFYAGKENAIKCMTDLNDGFLAELTSCNILGSRCHNRTEALAHAQCAFFISIIVVQWSDILICKTRTLSIKQQGLRNGMLNFGLLFETVLGAALCYIKPLNPALGTRPIEFVHWLPAIPFAIFIMTYDETRKFLMRNMGKGNWLEKNTYY